MDFDKLIAEIPKDPIKWTIQDVGKWLDFIGLTSLKDTFCNSCPKFLILQKFKIPSTEPISFNFQRKI
jgi:hypothetical protein